jgi:flavin-dependent dehydrogenase
VYVATPYIDSTFHVWFHPKLEGGYVWAFPLGDGYLNLGAIARARMGRDVVEITRRLVNAGGSETMKLEWEDTEDRVRAWPIPTSTRTLTYPNGTIVVGDAAGAGDPMTGEGIWGALVTARYAADAIISHPYQPHHAAAHYRAHVNRWLEVRQRTARIYRRMLVHPMFVNVAVHSMNLHQKLRERYGALIMDETLRHTFKDSLTMVMLGR